jgi:hypothetical protein
MKAFNSYRKDFDESNAEASEKHELIELKFKPLKREKKTKRQKRTHRKTPPMMKANNEEARRHTIPRATDTFRKTNHRD